MSSHNCFAAGSMYFIANVFLNGCGQHRVAARLISRNYLFQPVESDYDLYDGLYSIQTLQFVAVASLAGTIDSNETPLYISMHSACQKAACTPSRYLRVTFGACQTCSLFELNFVQFSNNSIEANISGCSSPLLCGPFSTCPFAPCALHSHDPGRAAPGATPRSWPQDVDTQALVAAF